jgi:predicted nucleic acid-binding Zn ribbon protein
MLGAGGVAQVSIGREQREFLGDAMKEIPDRNGDCELHCIVGAKRVAIDKRTGVCDVLGFYRCHEIIANEMTRKRDFQRLLLILRNPSLSDPPAQPASAT